MIYIIGIGPGGSTKYLTGRAIEAIGSVHEAIYVGEMIGPEIKRLFAGKKLTTGRLTIEEVSGRLESALNAGSDLALLVPGDPCLYSGQDGRERTVGQYVEWLRSRRAEFEVIPGISSWMALCASAGLDMTEFGTSQAVLVVSLERMLSVSADKNLDWDALEKLNWDALREACVGKPALVLFQSYAQRAKLTKFLQKHYPPGSEVILGYKVSWPEEKILRMPLSVFVRESLGDDLAKHSIIIILPPKSSP